MTADIARLSAALNDLSNTWKEQIDVDPTNAYDEGYSTAKHECFTSMIALLKLHGPALLAAAKYEEANPLGGPATMLEAAARRIRAGEDFHEVLADYGLLARQEGEDWLPIESAPKKGRVMLYDADRIPSILIAHWRHGAWWGDMTNSGRSIVWRDATHWRTLPAPPAARSGGGGGG